MEDVKSRAKGVGRTEEELDGNGLYFLLGFSVNLKLLQKIKIYQKNRGTAGIFYFRARHTWP